MDIHISRLKYFIYYINFTYCLFIKLMFHSLLVVRIFEILKRLVKGDQFCLEFAEGLVINSEIFSSKYLLRIDRLIMLRAKRNRYLVDQRDVFFPAPWFLKYRGVRQSELPQRIERTNVYIVLPMFTLQELSLRVIKNCLTCDSQAFLLHIPRSLQLKLFTMLPRKPRPS